MMGLHQLSPSRSFLVAYGTDDDPVEWDSLGTAIGCLVHAGRLSNPRGNCQFKMNGPLRCYTSETLTEPFPQPQPGIHRTRQNPHFRLTASRTALRLKMAVLREGYRPST